MKQVVALFGEAEKGQFKTPYTFHKLSQLVDFLGHPPKDSEGLFFAVQALLYRREVLYFRVTEEGLSKLDYFSGLKHLEQLDKIKKIDALCLPGVGDKEILEAADRPCSLHKSPLLMSEKDFFDYLTFG